MARRVVSISLGDIDDKIDSRLADLDKSDVGLGDVDNTSDMDKPVSIAVQSALDGKANTADLGILAAKDKAAVSDIDAAGSPGDTTYLRGDGTWSTPPVGGGSGGGGGAVDSVNGQTGTVVLDADDISDDGTVNKFVSTTEKTKLAGIEAGAQVNVQADWNAASGDALVLNKPTSFLPSPHTHGVADLTATGTKSSSTYLAGDDTWRTPPDTTYNVMPVFEGVSGASTAPRVLNGTNLRQIIMALAAPVSHSHSEYAYPEINPYDLTGTSPSLISPVNLSEAISSEVSGTYAPTGHNHDSRYYTQAQVDAMVEAAKPIPFTSQFNTVQSTTDTENYVYIGSATISVPAGTYRVTGMSTMMARRSVATGDIWTVMRIGGSNGSEATIVLTVGIGVNVWVPATNRIDGTITTTGEVTLQWGYRGGVTAGTTQVYRGVMYGTLERIEDP